MNKKYITRKALQTVVLFFGLGFTACSTDEGFTPPSGNNHQVTITAYQPQADNKGIVRMGFNSNGAGYWHQGDEITILYSEATSGSILTLTKFTLSEGAGQTSGSFTGNMNISTEEVASLTAYYPYNDKHTFNTYNLPNTYTYDGVNEDYTYTENGKSANMPMYSTIKTSSTSDLQAYFKPLGAVLAIKVNHLPAASGTITVSANEIIAGDATFGVASTENTENSATKTFQIKTPTTGSKTVTFNYKNATIGQEGVFYLPLPAGSYTGVKVKVAGSSDSDPSYTGGGDNGISFTLELGHIKKLKVNTDYDLTIDGHTFVNLGLKSGTLWATTNIGATNEADCGDYYAWGETATKDTYTPENYNYFTVKEVTQNEQTFTVAEANKYNSQDQLSELVSSDDAAYTVWGSYCSMPTQDQFNELTGCTWTWGSKTNSNNETVYGYTVTSKTNSKSIFLPCTGFMINNSIYTESASKGYYWTKTLDTVMLGALKLEFNSSKVSNVITSSSLSDAQYRSTGCAVRAIIGKPNTGN